jgi:Flp pilus assembly protein TadB
MTFDDLKRNINQIKEIIREAYVFLNQLEAIEKIESGKNVIINDKEKTLLNDAINALIAQLRILNNSVPSLVEGIGFFKKLEGEGKPEIIKRLPEKSLIQIQYQQGANREKVAITISDNDRKDFLENLSRSNLSINQLKKRFAAEELRPSFGKPNFYAKISNRFFRDISNNLMQKGYLKNLNEDLRKMNSPFVVNTYLSMILFTVTISFIASLFLLVVLLFFHIGLTFPFLIFAEEGPLARLLQKFWIILAIPMATGLLMYFYPKSEGKSIGSKINQELPFVTIHMSSIATSGVEPVSIFNIIIKSEEYKYTRLEFRKLINLINFQGNDLVTALKKVAKTSPSAKLKELLDGLATTITSGGDMHTFLDKHSESLLFDYKLEREKYTKTSETFMDIYISIVIAAPMILLMIFVIMGSTGMYFMGLNTQVMSLLIIMAIVVLNIAFLVFLRIKQPVY